MSYFKICPRCGAHLDPGEVCDCQGKEKTPASAANTGGGGVDTSDQTVSTSMITENGGFVK